MQNFESVSADAVCQCRAYFKHSTQLDRKSILMCTPNMSLLSFHMLWNVRTFFFNCKRGYSKLTYMHIVLQRTN